MQEKNYVFANTEKGSERERLEILQQIFDPFTQQNIDRLGIDRGWKCLEVGCGAGSIMNWLVDRVGDTGKVVAVDLDPRFVEGIEKPNLEIRQQDITKDKLEPETYDLIHTRVVLMHVLDRPAALNNMLAALKPDGWLLLEEADFSAFIAGEMDAIDRGIIQRLSAASKQTIVNLGGDPELGTKLPSLMQNAGLRNIDTNTGVAEWRYDFAKFRTIFQRLRLSIHTLNQQRPNTSVEMFQGGSARSKIWQMAVAQITPKLLETELITQSDLDRFFDLIVREDIWMMDYAIVAAWGQKNTSIETTRI